jgi:2-C-methyl-D-erythritol 4-phosphate cytidylyltransferase/2-C-methyl-D-erythritol 2,4-cyclodiphosphate synthase
MHVTAIIAAGGRGERVGSPVPKQFLTVGGRELLEHSVNAFLAHPAIDEVIVALPRELSENPPVYLKGSAKRLRIVAGGARRQDSVAAAFRAASKAADIIVVHDAARPFVGADLIARTIAAASESGAALAALQARDTVKRARAQDSAAGRPGALLVGETLLRDSIYLAQTPQAFRRTVLEDALALNEEATDEATLAERAGHPVRLVEGEATNIKITTAEDLPVAEAIARAHPRTGDVRAVPPSAPARTGRAGTGYDLHRLVPGRPLIVGGVAIPSDRGALGHSDADVVCHAVIDAILGAACLGDVGRHFPDSDGQWKDASSLDLLSRAVAMIADQGLEVGNVDVTVVLEAPKIRDYIDAMRLAVARAIGIDAGRVSIKGKTNEGMDAVGRREAIAAHAIALIRTR